MGAFFLDTTGFANGVHTIWWIAYDNEARGTGSAPGTSRSPTRADRPRPRRRNAGRGATALPISFSPVLVKTGYDLNAEFLPRYPDAEGIVRIEIPEVNRVEIELGDDPEAARSNRAQRDSAAIDHRERAQSSSRRLDPRPPHRPLLLDAGAGIPGDYDLVFLINDKSRIIRKIPFKVTIKPKY